MSESSPISASGLARGTSRSAISRAPINGCQERGRSEASGFDRFRDVEGFALPGIGRQIDRSGDAAEGKRLIEPMRAKRRRRVFDPGAKTT
jgi:hypothetical protein